jgi:hypothetical protein
MTKKRTADTGHIRSRWTDRPPKDRPFDNIAVSLRDFSGEGLSLWITPDEALLLSVELQIAVLGSQKHDPAYRKRYVTPRERLAGYKPTKKR